MPEHPPPSPDPSAIRVASVPAAHPYVEHLGLDGVVRLADPTPPGAPPGRWWPPVMLDPAWISAHAASFDLLHVHFGVESFAPEQLEGTVAALRAAGRPLVQTVHDLVNPQLAAQAAHRAQLDVLVPAADALITLTPGAAAEIGRRWGRAAEVIAHPHILPLATPAPAGRAGRARIVGLHLRDLRPNVDGEGATCALLGAVAALRARGVAVVARVELHDRVRDAAVRDAVRRCCDGVAHVTLIERARPSDAELAADLADLDAAVLPYAHGTHSGWLELCWDLGVPVAAPAVGRFAEQHLEPGAVASFDPRSAASLSGALAALLELETKDPARPGTPARVARQAARRATRRRQQAVVATAHLAVYRRVMER